MLSPKLSIQSTILLGRRQFQLLDFPQGITSNSLLIISIVDVVVHLAAALAALEACETSAARVGISHSLPSMGKSINLLTCRSRSRLLHHHAC